MNYTNLKGKRYVNLVRCSTMQQADTSPEDQLNLLNRFAAERDMIHAGKDWVLEGVSGSRPDKRTDIDEIIAYKCAGNDFDVLLVQDVSRLTRGGTGHFHTIQWNLNAVGVAIVFATGTSSGDADQDDIMHGLGAYSAKLQAKQMSFSSTRGQASSITNGTVPHAFITPFGIDRLFVDLASAPRHRIRNLVDGSQQMLAVADDTVLAHYPKNPEIGASPHYRRQSDERVVLVAGDPRRVEIVRRIYRHKLVDGWGVRRIAIALNDEGVPAAKGGPWSTSSIETILNNPVYTGLGIGNRFVAGIYNIRGKDLSPVPLTKDFKDSFATYRSRPLRPQEDWIYQDHPQLADYLGDDLKPLAIEWHAAAMSKQSERAAKPAVKKKPGGDKHVDSPYILKGLLRSMQGGHPLSGAKKGPKRYQKRYYSVGRADNVPRSNDVLRRYIPAEPLERAVLDAISDVLLDDQHLRESVEKALNSEQKARATETSQLASLAAERDKLTENLRGALLLGPASMKRMSKDLEQWEAALEVLERRIASLEKAEPMQPHDVDAFVAAVSAEFKKMAESLGTVPSNTVRQLLASVVTRLEIDMATLAVQMEVALPQSVSATKKGPVLGLVPIKRWTEGNDTQRSGTLKIADVACRGTVGTAKKPPCFVCSRLAA